MMDPRPIISITGEEPIWHLFAICGTIFVTGCGWVAAVWKLVTNHMEHQKDAIIVAANENTKTICQAVVKSGQETVIAIQQCLIKEQS
jgi:hypothetical protein